MSGPHFRLIHPWAFADELRFSYVLAIRSQVSAMCKSMTRWEAFLSVWAKHRLLCLDEAELGIEPLRRF